MLPDLPGLSNDVSTLNGLWPTYSEHRSEGRDAVAVIVPFRARSPSHAQSLCDHYLRLCPTSPTGWTFIIADSSPFEIFKETHGRLGGSGILHLRPQSASAIGANDKLNNVVTALRWSNSTAVCLFDDDARPTIDVIAGIAANLARADCVRAMVHYERPDLFDLIDLSGIYIVNALTRRKQFWGNIAFRRDALSPTFFAPHAVLFDELFLETKGLRQPCTTHYQISPPLDMKGAGRNWREYLDQRVRYAYEDLAQPAKAAFGFALLPVAAVTYLIDGLLGVAMLLAAVSMICFIAAVLGGLVYSRDNRNRIAALFGPLWFLPYGVTMWIAIYKRLAGKGVRFGRSTIRTPA